MLVVLFCDWLPRAPVWIWLPAWLLLLSVTCLKAVFIRR